MQPIDRAKPAERCVFVANRLPWPLVDGWTRRTFHVVEALAAEWPVDLIVFDHGDATAQDAATRAFGGRVRIVTIPSKRWRRYLGLLRGLLGSRPLHVTAHEDPAFHAAVEEARDRTQARIWGAAGVYLAPYLPEQAGMVRFIDTHNIDSLAVARYAEVTRNPLRRWFTRRTAAQLRMVEREEFARAELVVVCSDPEIALVHDRAPRALGRVVPNGVDLDAFTMAPATTGPRPPSLLFFGRLDYFPNVDAIEYFRSEIIDRIRAEIPEVRVQIAGAGNAQAMTAAVRGHPAFDILGQVPDITATLADATMTIVPLRVGGGTRLKILEAMAAGRPIVSTSVGAEGIEVEDDHHLLLRDGATAFADGVIALVRDPARAQRLARAARQQAEARYSWQALGALLRDDIRAQLAASRPVTALSA